MDVAAMFGSISFSDKNPQSAVFGPVPHHLQAQ